MYISRIIWGPLRARRGVDFKRRESPSHAIHSERSAFITRYEFIPCHKRRLFYSSTQSQSLTARKTRASPCLLVLETYKRPRHESRALSDLSDFISGPSNLPRGYPCCLNDFRLHKSMLTNYLNFLCYKTGKISDKFTPKCSKGQDFFIRNQHFKQKFILERNINYLRV